MPSLTRSLPISIQNQPKFFLLLPSFSNITSFIFKLLSLNLHNLNLQTSITFFKLHQITQNNSKLHPKPNPPMKNNNHPSQLTNHQIRIPFYPNPQTPISSPIFTQTLKNLTYNQNPSLKPLFPHKILPKPNLHLNLRSMASKRKGGKFALCWY